MNLEHLFRFLQPFFFGRPSQSHFCHFAIGGIGWVLLSISLGGLTRGVPPINPGELGSSA